MFSATHRIHLPNSPPNSTILVMEIDGAAYTQAEFEAADMADYEVDADGAWTCQGRAFGGWVERLPSATPNDGPAVDMDGPAGPVVDYSAECRQEEVDAALPAGWAADYSSQIAVGSGDWRRFRAPLVEMAS